MTRQGTAAEIAENAAQGGGFIKTAEMVGRTFRLDGYETIMTKFGDRYVATICFDGNTRTDRMWASGMVLQRQIDALADAGIFPVTVRLERPDDRYYKFIVLAEPNEGVPSDDEPSRPGE